MNMRRVLLPVLVCLVLLCGCKRKEERPSTPLAQVNGETLYLEDFRATFSDEQWAALSPEQKKQEIEDWVNVTLLAQAAEEQKLDQESGVKQRIDYAARKIKANALIARRMSQMEISEEALFAYYRLHRSDFQGKLQEYDVQRIFLTDANAASILFKRLQEGLNFDEAALSYSQEPLKDKLGYMGYVTANGPDSLFWRAVHGLKKDEPGRLATADGVYLLRYINQREGSKEANFEDYKGEIRAILLAEKLNQVYEDLLRELKAKDNKIHYY